MKILLIRDNQKRYINTPSVPNKGDLIKLAETDCEEIFKVKSVIYDFTMPEAEIIVAYEPT